MFFSLTSQGSIYWEGGASIQMSQLPPKNRFPEKNIKLFQIKISVDDDFKESVKVTDVQKCDFWQS